MRHFLLALLVILATTAGAATVTVDRDLGFDPVDSTAFLQAAFDGTADTVVIRAMPSPWITSRLFLRRSNVTVILEPGAVLEAKLGGFPRASDCLLQVHLCSDITIVGYGATIRMLNGSDPAYTDGESRHCFALRGVERALVQGLTCTKAGGDGIYVSGGWEGDRTYTSHATIEDCRLIDNRRQGISVISAQDLLIRRCVMQDTGVTSGTDPMAGIDFEPDRPEQRLVRCVMRECSFSGNSAMTYSTGIHTFVGYLDASSLPVDITIERCHVTSTREGAEGSAVHLDSSRAVGPQVTYALRHSLIEDCRSSALHLASGLGTCAISIDGCVVRNAHTLTPAWGGTPIYLEGQSADFDAYGNIDFADCLVVDDRDRPFIRSYEGRTHLSLPPTHCENLSGTVTVVNPNPAGWRWNLGSANDVDITLAVTGLAAMPTQEVAISIDGATLVEGASRTVTVTRVGSTAFPLGVDLAWSGTAIAGDDYGYIPGFALIPAGESSTTWTVAARADGVAEPAETISVALVARAGDYTGSTVAHVITVIDSAADDPGQPGPGDGTIPPGGSDGDSSDRDGGRGCGTGSGLGVLLAFLLGARLAGVPGRRA